MLYQTIRPKSLDKIAGNDDVIESLRQIVKAKPEDRPHAYMFQGPSGCGKTTLARILASEFGCDPIDIQEINAANMRGIDTIREIAAYAGFAPMNGKAKCYVLDESHQLTDAAQQALLKVLEECPIHVYLMLCTTDPQQIITTVQNRCAIYTVSKLRRSSMEKFLFLTCRDNNFSTEPEVIAEIVKISDGCPRQALMLLEQTFGMEVTREKLLFLKSESAEVTETIELCRELATKSTKRWQICSNLLKSLDQDAEKVRRSILSYFDKALKETTDIEQASRFAEIVMILEKSTFTGGRATLTRMIFQACLIE